jgi:hypothetical protein
METVVGAVDSRDRQKRRQEGGKRMKVECPVCGVHGILEVRGNSQRVLHYRGFFNDKRVYEKHSIKMGINDGSNGNKQMGINKSVSGFFNDNTSRGWELNPYIAALQAAA